MMTEAEMDKLFDEWAETVEWSWEIEVYDRDDNEYMYDAYLNIDDFVEIAMEKGFSNTDDLNQLFSDWIDDLCNDNDWLEEQTMEWMERNGELEYERRERAYERWVDMKIDEMRGK